MTYSNPKRIAFEYGAIAINCRGDEVFIDFTEALAGSVKTDDPKVIEKIFEALDYAAFVAWGKEWSNRDKNILAS